MQNGDPGHAAAPPLTGVRVLTFGEIYPAPYATLLLADLGADVVMVERAGGDPARRFPPLFRSLNRGKRSIALDLKQSAAVKCALRLVADADVVLEGFRPGAMERLGLGYEQARAVNPRVVYASLTGFGRQSPYGSRPAHDLSFQALAGVLEPQARTGVPEPPGILPLGDAASGLFAALGILAALLGRERTGAGAHVDVAVLDSLLSLMTPSLCGILNGGTGADLPPAQPAYGCFPTADGRLVSLSVTVQDAFWRRLCGALRLDDVAELPLPERTALRVPLGARVADAIAARTRDEWERILADADVPFGAVHGLPEVAGDPHLAARGLLTTLAGETFVRQPVAFDGNVPGPERGVAELGEHSVELLAAVGMTDAELDDLLAAGAVVAPSAAVEARP